MSLRLSSLLPIPNPKDYKVHLACWNGKNQPLDVFVRDPQEWNRWNTWRAGKDEFNRPYILALIDFYPEPGIWLLGGVYKVFSRAQVNHAHSYKVEEISDYAELVGRLKICFIRPGRNRSVKLENYFEQMSISELLKERYTGERFPGYENISRDFGALEAIFKNDRPDWKSPLENMKGVYLIVDRSNGKKYVGSAYGDVGVWARWKCYMETGHGGNDELTALITRKGMDL